MLPLKSRPIFLVCNKSQFQLNNRVKYFFSVKELKPFYLRSVQLCSVWPVLFHRSAPTTSSVRFSTSATATSLNKMKRYVGHKKVLFMMALLVYPGLVLPWKTYPLKRYTQQGRGKYCICRVKFKRKILNIFELPIIENFSLQ